MVIGMAAMGSGHGRLGLGTAIVGWVAAAASLHTEKRMVHPKPLESEVGGWEAVAGALATSPNAVEREHLYLGTVPGLPYEVPNLVSRSLLGHHMLACGPTGSGKTNLALVPILFQEIDRGDASPIIIDAKGARETALMIRDRAEARGQKFFLFSLDPRVPGHLYSVFQDPAFRALFPLEKYQVLAKAFGTQKGEGHGEGFFSSMNRDPLAAVFEHFPDVGSFREIYERITNPDDRRRMHLTKRNLEAGAHLLSCLKEMGRVPQADPRPEDGIPKSYFDNAIQLERAFSEPTPIYFYLPASVNQAVVRFIARTAIHTVAARSRTIQVDHPHIRLVCEEASAYLESSLRLPLVQLRDKKVSFIISTQNVADLRTKDEDMRDAVLNSTHVKLFLGVHDADGREYLTRESGERRDTLAATSATRTESEVGSAEGVGSQRREVVVPRIGAPELELVNNTADLAVFEASPQSGFTRPRHPLIVRLPFPTTAAEYAAYQAMPWPEAVPGVTICGADIRRPPPPPDALVPVPTPTPPPTDPSSSATPPRPTRKSRRKPPTPEQATRAAEAAEYLKRLKDEE